MASWLVAFQTFHSRLLFLVPSPWIALDVISRSPFARKEIDVIILYIIIYKYSENSDNSTDKGGSLRSPISRAQSTAMEQEREGESERLGKRQATMPYHPVKRARLFEAERRENRSMTASHPPKMAA